MILLFTTYFLTSRLLQDSATRVLKTAKIRDLDWCI